MALISVLLSSGVDRFESVWIRVLKWMDFNSSAGGLQANLGIPRVQNVACEKAFIQRDFFSLAITAQQATRGFFHWLFEKTVNRGKQER